MTVDKTVTALCPCTWNEVEKVNDSIKKFVNAEHSGKFIHFLNREIDLLNMCTMINYKLEYN